MFRCHPLQSYLLLVTVILATSGRGACLCRQDQSAALLLLKAGFHFDATPSTTCVGPSPSTRSLRPRLSHPSTAYLKVASKPSSCTIITHNKHRAPSLLKFPLASNHVPTSREVTFDPPPFIPV
ncbi:hypothetical protein SETIT_6G163900v2 [Setaria italica]|uniref:Secreted protein n=1 Tax=Setaria italica TaxID=4555 RepID=A0A368RM49_SETIT|nr:hypothetical protein SETIT_6G163900v2 [Setaria italica]